MPLLSHRADSPGRTSSLKRFSSIEYPRPNLHAAAAEPPLRPRPRPRPRFPLPPPTPPPPSPLHHTSPVPDIADATLHGTTRVPNRNPQFPTQSVGEMSSASEMQPLAPAGYRRAPEMKDKVEAPAVDLEAGTGETLYPGISRGESALRWGFVRKVYGILAAQLLLTTAVSAVTVLHPTLNSTLSSSPGLALALAVLPFVLMIPLYHYQHKHPHNFVFLGLFTLCLSFSIGVACANTQGKIVLEALILTSAVVASLTAYTFWASKKGKEFGYLGPFLFSGLTLLVLTSFIQIFFPLGPASVALFGGLGALVFSGFILYDTENLIKRHTYDEYIWASVGLYLDILNLFLSILNMLRSMQSDN